MKIFFENQIYLSRSVNKIFYSKLYKKIYYLRNKFIYFNYQRDNKFYYR